MHSSAHMLMLERRDFIHTHRIWIRYSQFENLYQLILNDLTTLESILAVKLPPFPRKLLVHSASSLESRRGALELWLDCVIATSRKLTDVITDFSSLNLLSARLNKALSVWVSRALTMSPPMGAVGSEDSGTVSPSGGDPASAGIAEPDSAPPTLPSPR